MQHDQTRCQTKQQGHRPRASCLQRRGSAGKWIVPSHQAFSSAEWMRVTIAGKPYEIAVTDSQHEADGVLLRKSGPRTRTAEGCPSWSGTCDMATSASRRNAPYGLAPYVYTSWISRS